jgi:hypothetical protein
MHFAASILGLLDHRRRKNQTTRNMPIAAIPRVTPMTVPSHVGVFLPLPGFERLETKLPIAEDVDVVLEEGE